MDSLGTTDATSEFVPHTNVPHPYPLNPPPAKRQVSFRTSAADIGLRDVANVAKWYTYGQNVHQIVRKVNQNRALNDHLGILDVYAILWGKVQSSLIAPHSEKYLAKDELTPAQFNNIYQGWCNWRGENALADEYPKYKPKAIRSVIRALRARYFTETEINIGESERVTKAQMDAWHEQHDDMPTPEQVEVKEELKRKSRTFSDLERKYNVLKSGKRVLVNGRMAFVLYVDDVETYDKASTETFKERDLAAENEIIKEEITLLKEEEFSEKELEKIAESILPTNSLPQEQCDVIDDFTDSIEFDFESLGIEPDEIPDELKPKAKD